MTRFVGTPLTGVEFANLGDEALSVRILSDAHARLRIDAGGRLTWSSGSASGDVNLYRDGANALITDDTFEASSGIITLVTNGAPTSPLPDGALAVDTTNDRFYFRSGGSWEVVQGGAIVSATQPSSALEGALWFNSSNSELSVYSGSSWTLVSGGGGGGASVAVSDTPPVSGSNGDLWFESDTGGFYVYYSGTWAEIGGGSLNYLSGLLDVSISAPTSGQVLKYNGTAWVNDTDNTGGGGSSSVTVSDTAPVSPTEGDLWWNTVELEMYVYYSSSWVQATQNDQLITDLADLADVSDTVPTNGQVLQFNNATAEWEPTTLSLGAGSLSDLDDVAITSASNGDFLRWNGTDWVNDAVNLSTDTIGDYVEDLTAGTGITISGSGGEASSPTISVTANTYDAFGSASTAEANANAYTDTQIGALSIPSGITDLDDVAVTSPSVGQVLKWNGTAWVNSADDTGTTINSLDDIGDVVLTSLTSGQVLKWNGTNWVNGTDIDTDTDTGSIITASDTEPTSPSSGDMWWDTSVLELFVYSGGTWVQVTDSSPGVEELADLVDVADTAPTDGQILQYNSVTSEWEPATIATSVSSIDEIGDVTITSPSVGQVIKWNGSAWVNDTDNAGTSITSLDDIGDVAVTSPSVGQVLKWNGTAWVNGADNAGTTINSLDDIGDVSITSASSGDFLKWNGTAWVNDPINLATDTVGNYVSNVSAGTGVTVTHTPSEGSIPTVSIGQPVGVDDAPFFEGVFVKESGVGFNYSPTTGNQTRIVASSTPSNANYITLPDASGTVALNGSIALGADTTGNYMSGISAGTGITVTHTPGEGSTATVGLNATLDNLSDVTVPTPSLNDVLQWNGTAWVNVAASTVGATNLDGLSDVVITAPEEFQTLEYDGTNWVNKHASVVSYVRNAESTTITTGTVVYLFGATGDHATVKRADNNSDTTSSKTVGLAGADIIASGNGPVVTRGYVDGIDLSTGYTAGDILWLGENGAFTKTKPTAPDHLVFVGVVVRATNNGIIYVAAQNGYELDELHNVSIPSPSSGDFLKYDGSLWVNDQIDLGTDTVGNYVQSLVAGTGVTLTNGTPSEGGTPTIAIGQAVATTDNVTFAGVTADNIRVGVTGANEIDTSSGNLTIDSAGGTVTIDDNLTVTGDLTVSGTTTSINTETLTVDDNVIVLNNNVTSSPTENAGIEIERGTSTNVMIRWNETTDKWEYTNDGSTYIPLDAGAMISASAPTSPVDGMLWFDSDTGETFVYYDSSWIEVGGTSAGARMLVQTTAPSAPVEGEMWFDSDTAQTFVYYDSQWIEIGASAMAAVVSDGAPSDPIDGQIWFESDTGVTYVYYNSVWVEIGATAVDSLLSTVNAKGDLLVGTADNTVDNLTVGSNGQILVANSSTTTGLEWQTPNYASTGKAIAMSIVFGG